MRSNARVSRLVFWALFATLLISSSGITCERPGNTRLSSLEFQVLDVNRIAFDPMLRVYDVWLPAGATTVTVRAQAADPAATTIWYVQAGGGAGVSGELGVGGGEVTLDLPPDGHLLGVGVYPSGGAIGRYTVNVNPVCPQGDPCHNGGLPGTCINDVCEEDALCPVLTNVLIAPLQADVGDEITVSAAASDEQGDMIDYLWSGSGGVFADPSAASTTYTCLEIGQHDINIAVSDDDFTNCVADFTLPITCLPMCTEDVDCDDGNECTTDTCDPADGMCDQSNAAGGTPCSGGVCDGAGTCAAPACALVPDFDEVDWQITGDAMAPMAGTIDTSAPGSYGGAEVFGLPPSIGPDYTIEMDATTPNRETCIGSADFGTATAETTEVLVSLQCAVWWGACTLEDAFGLRASSPPEAGNDGCSRLTKAVVSPLQTSIGWDIDLFSLAEDPEDDPIEFIWTGTGGSFAEPSATATTYTCEQLGVQTITIVASDDGFNSCLDEWTFEVTCVE